LTRVPTAVALCVAFGNLNAQPSGLRTPLTGFVFDPQSHAVRPIMGLPGAAQLGEPLALPFTVRAAEFSSKGDYAVVIAAAGAKASLVRNLSANPYIQNLNDAITKLDRISLNESASTAVLYSAASNQLQFVSDLPDQPQLSAPISLNSIPGAVTALAVAARGQSALVAASDGTYGTVSEIRGAAAPKLLVSAYRPSAVLYLDGDRDIAYADAFSNQIMLVRDAQIEREVRVLASEADHVQTPVALRWADGALLVANTGSGNILRCDLGTGTNSDSGPLPVAPVQLQGLLVSNMFVINAPGHGPLYIYSAVDSSLLFVPPASARRTPVSLAPEGRRSK